MEPSSLRNRCRTSHLITRLLFQLLIIVFPKNFYFHKQTDPKKCLCEQICFQFTYRWPFVRRGLHKAIGFYQQQQEIAAAVWLQPQDLHLLQSSVPQSTLAPVPSPFPTLTYKTPPYL